MIDKKELDENIAEIVNSRNQSAQMCAKLANLYIIRDKLYGRTLKDEYNSYSTASAPSPISTLSPRALDLYGSSDFLKTVEGKDDSKAWAVMDVLMDTLKVVNPRVYESFLEKMRNL